MLIRIFLILTILAGIGTIVVTQFQVRPHIQGIIDEREFQTDRAVRAEGSLAKTRKELEDTQGTLRETKNNLNETQTQLAATKNELSTERNRANGLQKSLDDTRAELRAARQELSAWEALGIPVQQVKEIIALKDKLEVAIDALKAEKEIINNQLEVALKKIEFYERGLGPDVEKPLPPGIRGRVLVVDPKWQFVVLNLGSQDNVEPNGVLMVSRQGKLVAKVMVRRVEPTRCIANIMPGWSFEQIREGDNVFN